MHMIQKKEQIKNHPIKEITNEDHRNKIITL